MVDVGPSTPQASSEFDPNGYWSPATQLGLPNNLQKDMSAASSSSIEDNHGLQGMNKSAVEFVPGGGPDMTDSATSQVDQDPLVEVQYGDRTLVVPQSLTEVDPNTGEPYYVEATETQEAGLSWMLNNVTFVAPPKRSMHTIGMPENMRQHFAALDVESSRCMNSDDDRYKELPQRFGKAYPLDDPNAQRGAGGSFGYPSMLYKALDQFDGNYYAVRRFENVRSNVAVLKAAMDKWSAARHPSIVSLRNISQERGATFVTHTYHAGATTLQQRFLDQRGPLVQQALLWRLVTQLLAGMRYAHSRNMPLRMVSPQHILVTSGTRFRFNSVGVMEVLEFETRKSIQDLFTEDLVRLGMCILSIATRVPVVKFNSSQHRDAMSLLQNHCSQAFIDLVTMLINATPALTCDAVCTSIAPHFVDEGDMQMAVNDGLHSHLQCEYENGRILKLLIKLGFINERPEYDMSPKWGETGDRYVLRLFRDYVFHQCLEDGAPVLDAGHVISALNKLDGQSDERMALSSRRSNDLLVVSYADVQRCLEDSFRDLCRQSERAMPQEYHDMHNNARRGASRMMETSVGAGHSAAAAAGGGGGGRSSRDRHRVERPRDNSHRY